MCPDPQSSKELRISITHSAECAVLKFKGTLNDLTANQAQSSIDKLLNDHAPRGIVIDLKELTMISSTGLTFLIQLSHRCADLKIGLQLINAQDQVDGALRIIKTALDEISKPSSSTDH